MIRDVSLSEISDGRLYRSNDMVKADTGGCTGCSRCCREMVDTIFLDPWDLYHLAAGLRRSAARADGPFPSGGDDASGVHWPSAWDAFGVLLEKEIISLDLADGLILPRLANTARTGACPFLDAKERCSIHDYRPGFCRLFPLGRCYEGEDFFYFLQVHECDRARGKVKIKKWLDIPELPRYEAYILRWHHFLRRAGQAAEEGPLEIRQSAEEGPLEIGQAAEEGAPESRQAAAEKSAGRKRICMEILKIFYQTPWETESDFYPQFEERLARAYDTNFL